MENVATEEFISRTEALKDFESCNAENPNWTPQRVKTLLLRQPAANVAEVAQGHWIMHNDDFGLTCECSHCHIETMGDSEYCLHCGARMDGGSEC